MSSPPEAGTSRRLPELSNAGLKATADVIACNEFNEPVAGAIAVERALTIYLDKREIVTLMTLGNHPELLILGWLRNQRMIDNIEAVKAIQVDWEAEAVAITTREGIENLDEKLGRKTVTTGCGQGTVFGDLMENIDQIALQQPVLRQSSIYALLNTLNEYNEIYKNAGAVHGCALCSENNGIEQFIEDVGRHNAVDAIAGYMWLNRGQGQTLLHHRAPDLGNGDQGSVDGNPGITVTLGHHRNGTRNSTKGGRYPDRTRKRPAFPGLSRQ
jgi:FdhD protein